MTEYLDVPGGRIAYDVTGEGPLVVLSHGIGDHRQAYRFLVPTLVEAGYRVANADMRGHGESSMGWDSISRTDVAGDLLALIRHLGGPAVIVGHSLSGGAATIAAATEPELVSAVVEINPFTKTQKLDVGAFLKVGRYRKGLTHLMATQMLGSLSQWDKYLDVAYPTKPADYQEYVAVLLAKLREPGRQAEFKKTGKSTPADAEAQLPNLTRPALVIMGAQDPDFPDPKAEGDAVVALMPAGVGTVAVVERAGHYPHAGNAAQVADLILPFLKSHTAV
ncbi:alpha/beta hydrolase [Actinomadura barringtoniae]|uniref:Alpha/beta hydrolase n=1 Tax=Actinomadura barringtoniae TaxID=1427535 RepID=A0A939PFB7_9ACTN|nr:alpha/beta hydrolase [Actinomadura barringtoniae]MBO2451172.1 alpha/beta hydrolase [Actinomadura barringtoniae]